MNLNQGLVENRSESVDAVHVSKSTCVSSYSRNALTLAVASRANLALSVGGYA